MKKCPFCNSDSTYMDHIDIDMVPHFFRMCRGCGAQGPYHLDMKVAEAMWSSRTPQSEFQFNFARTKFVSENGLIKQLEHMSSELVESKEAFLQDPNANNLIDELMDRLHSTETALRIAQEKYGADLDASRKRVSLKNYERGYYS